MIRDARAVVVGKKTQPVVDPLDVHEMLCQNTRLIAASWCERHNEGSCQTEKEPKFIYESSFDGDFGSSVLRRQGAQPRSKQVRGQTHARAGLLP